MMFKKFFKFIFKLLLIVIIFAAGFVVGSIATNTDTSDDITSAIEDAKQALELQKLLDEYYGNNESDQTEASTAQTTSSIVTESSTAATTETPTTIAATTQVNGIRAEFKEAVDSYEAFMKEYCDFMVTYNNTADVTPQMIIDYTNYLSRYADMVASFEALDDDTTLTNEELLYYTEANSRVLLMLAETGLAIY